MNHPRKNYQWSVLVLYGNNDLRSHRVYMVDDCFSKLKSFFFLAFLDIVMKERSSFEMGEEGKKHSTTNYQCLL